MSSYQNWTTIQEQQEVRKFPFCTKESSLVWSTVAFDRRPTHKYFRVLRKGSRRDQDRERNLCFLVCLHFPVGRYHRCGDPGSPQGLPTFRLSSKPFCSARALMRLSQPRIFCSCGDFEVGAGVALASTGE